MFHAKVMVEMAIIDIVMYDDVSTYDVNGRPGNLVTDYHFE